ncbi:anti-termination [Providencia phage PSTCR6]|nr:anti-termination [Providencia phage PSTCR6]
MITKEQKYFQTYQNAKRRNKEFKLSLRTVENLLSQTHCSYSGKPFNEKIPKERLSFERIDNTLGYVDGNVIAVQEVYNKARGNLSLEEFANMGSQPSKDASKKINQKIQLERYYDKLKKLTKRLDTLNNKKTLDDSEKRLLKKWTKEINTKLSEIQFLKAAISKNTNDNSEINLENCKKGILRFTNLGKIDKLKVKYGLSLDTSILGLLKEIYVRIRINL